jgi:uncharacterized protein YegP (UPF0339 family)
VWSVRVGQIYPIQEITLRQKIELYKDRKGEFRWRLLSSKRIIACSGEGYSKKSGAKQGIKSVVKALSAGTLEDPKIPTIDLTLKATRTPARTPAQASG